MRPSLQLERKGGTALSFFFTRGAQRQVSFLRPWWRATFGPRALPRVHTAGHEVSPPITWQHRRSRGNSAGHVATPPVTWKHRRSRGHTADWADGWAGGRDSRREGGFAWASEYWCCAEHWCCAEWTGRTLVLRCRRPCCLSDPSIQHRGPPGRRRGRPRAAVSAAYPITSPLITSP